jgi:hypothetical protein
LSNSFVLSFPVNHFFCFDSLFQESPLFPGCFSHCFGRQIKFIFLDKSQVWEMLLLGKLGWDVSGVTAFDFVDHLMERLDLSSSSSSPVTNSSGRNVLQSTGSVRDSATVLRAHALTYVSLCCTGKHPTYFHLVKGGGILFPPIKVLLPSEKENEISTLLNEADDPSRTGRAAVSSLFFPLYYYCNHEKSDPFKERFVWNTRTNSTAPFPPFPRTDVYTLELFDASTAQRYYTHTVKYPPSLVKFFGPPPNFIL